MEYLAGPADKGFGAVRAKQGHPEPYTKSFNKIYLESANEAWNSIMKYAVPGRPEIYAAISDRQFRELKRSPLFAADKFEFVANGWDSSMERNGWTSRVAHSSREADRVDLAYYFGGWEKNADGSGSGDEIYQDKLFTSSLEYGRKLLDALLIDPGFSRRFAAAVKNDRVLLDAGFAGMRADNAGFTEEQLSGVPGDIPGLWEKDTQFAGSVKGLVASRREPLEYPFWHAAYRAMAKDPELSKRAVAALDLADPALLPELCESLIDLNAPGRVSPLLKDKPGVVERWRDSSRLTEPARAEIAAFSGKQEKIGYHTTNALNQLLRDEILGLLKEENPSLVSGIRKESTPELLQQKIVNHIDYFLRETLVESPRHRSDQLMLAMKKNPDFAVSAFDAIEKTPGIFAAEAQKIATLFSSAISDIFSGAESFKPDAEARMLFKNLPPDVRNELLDRLDKEFENMSGTLSVESRILLPLMTKAMRGDTGAAKKLADSEDFSRLLQNKLTASIPLPFLEAAKKDARIGDLLATQLARVPATGAKKMANYEGGPGYSLPGPGKPPSEDDENVGKSLALGTATLDLSMQFLAAGSSPIAYYDYATGDYWASHNNPVDRTPYPSWLGLKMRNTLCPGDLLKVDPIEIKRVDIPDKKVVKTTNDGKGQTETVKGRNGVALTSCYAFRDGTGVSLMLLNRSLTEPRTVELELPAGFSGPSQMYSLTHSDPKATNRKEENVKIQQSAGPEIKSGMKIVVPPASVVVVAGPGA